MNIAKAPIGNAVESVAPDHVVTTADQIYDEALGKYQSELNQEGGGGGGGDVNGVKVGSITYTPEQGSGGIVEIPNYEQGAEPNVQSDWDQTNSSAKDFIKNKPTIPAAQIQSDWNQTNTEAKDFIKNKPTVFGASGENHKSGLVPDTPSTQGNTKFLREDGTWQVPSGGSGGGVTGVKGASETNYRTGDVNITKENIGLGNVGNFKAVSTVESQGLSDTEKGNARTNIGAGTSNFSGSYNDLANKPTIPVVPTNVSAFTNDAGYLVTANIEGKADKSTTYTKTEVDSDISQLRSELNAKQLQVGAVATDSVPTKDSANRVTSGALYETLGELIATTTFSYNSAEHSSNNDRIKVSIKKGTVFSVYIQGSSTNFNSVAVFQNKHQIVGDYAQYVGVSPFKMVAIEDIEYMGFYLYNTTTTNQTILIEIRICESDNASHNMNLQRLAENTAGFTYAFEMPFYSGESGASYIRDSFYHHPRYVCRVTKGTLYTIILDSDTSVTYSAGSEYNAFIEVYMYKDPGIELVYENETQYRLQTIYAISKNEQFSRTVKTIRATEDGILAFAFLRIGEGERVNVTVLPHSTSDPIDSDMLRVNAMKYKQSTYGDYGLNWYPSFLAITDTHSSKFSIERAFIYAEKKCIDGVFLLGDIGDHSNWLVNYATKLEELRLGCSKFAIAVPGNHEYEYVANSDWVGLTDDETTSIYYSSNVVSKNGEVHPTIGGKFKNYYYKDITTTHTRADNKGTVSYTIRIIGLYQFEWNSPTDSQGHPTVGDGYGKDIPVYTQTQIDWFVQTLKDTPSDYGVIVLSHTAISKAVPVQCPFTIYTSSPELFARLGNTTFFYSIIDAWVRGTSCNVSSEQKVIDKNGTRVDNIPISVNTTFSGTHTFIANICGHHHAGGIFKMEDISGNASSYPVVLSPCTSDSDYQLSGWFAVDSTMGKMADCLNVYTYDFDRKRLKIARLGSDINSEGQEAKTYVIQL